MSFNAKKLLSLLLVIGLLTGSWGSIPVRADQEAIIQLTVGSTKAYVNFKEVTLDQPPIIENGRTLVPFRFIGEALGAFVDWNPSDNTVSYVLEDKNIVLKIGSTTAIVNGKEYKLDVPPKILPSGRTVVPVRFIGDAIGAKVDWNSKTKMVTITYTKEAVQFGGWLRDRVTADPGTFDPHANTSLLLFSACKNIYSNLVTTSAKDYTLMPDVAKSWTWSNDNKTVTFKLRDDVFFTDGTKLTANDVKFTFERVFDPNGPAITSGVANYLLPAKIVGAKDKVDGKAKEVSGIKVIDDYTISFTLEEPYGPFIQILAIPCFGILSEKQVEKYGEDYGTHPLGSGPFYIEEWKRGSYIKFAANTRYFKGRPPLDGFVWYVVEDDNTAVLKFENNELDVLVPPNSMYKDLTTKYAANVIKASTLSYYRITFNMTKPGPLQDKRVRLAIGYAIDRQAINDKILQGQGILAKGIFPPGLPGYNPNLPGFEYNLEKAKQLMKEAGYENGFTLKMVMRAGRMEDEHLAFQEALRKININVELVKVDRATYWQMLSSGQTDIAYRNWWADFADPDNFMTPLFHTGNNSMGACKPEYDALMDKAARMVDLKQRIPIYQDLEKKIIYEDFWEFPLWHMTQTVILSPYVRNYYLHPSGITNYYYVYLIKH
jgi:peptide/nickel transport system substrate-binding protein/oligopeptide transport system substrate-binding protein